MRCPRKPAPGRKPPEFSITLQFGLFPVYTIQWHSCSGPFQRELIEQAEMPKSKETPHRPQQTAKMSSITSYWASLAKPTERRPSYKINKDGIMGEISHWTLPILFRFQKIQYRCFSSYQEMFLDGGQVFGRLYGESLQSTSSSTWQYPSSTGSCQHLERKFPNLSNVRYVLIGEDKAGEYFEKVQ